MIYDKIVKSNNLQLFTQIVNHASENTIILLYLISKIYNNRAMIKLIETV